MRFVFLSGSFHSQSRSLMALKSLEAFFAGHQTHTPKLDALPFFNEDLNADKPAIVIDFLALVRDADGILCCTPEYNHSIPAVLKNAIDWASRPAFKSPLKGKPVTIVTQSANAVGGARAQAHLKLVLDSTLSLLHPVHEMMIPDIDQALGPDGSFKDAKMSARLERHIHDFIAFTERQKKVGFVHA